MTAPNLELADEINKDLTRYEAMWFLMEEFNSGLQELAKEDWISFRYSNISFLNPQTENFWISEKKVSVFLDNF